MDKKSRKFFNLFWKGACLRKIYVLIFASAFRERENKKGKKRRLKAKKRGGTSRVLHYHKLRKGNQEEGNWRAKV